MNSNITLQSNIYINKTAKSDDLGVLQHITDYRVLKQLKKSAGSYSDPHWQTSTQIEILRQGSPDCSYEKGTMSWGVPIGGEHMHCRCEQYDCPRFIKQCSHLWNFDQVKREEDPAAPVSPPNVDLSTVDPMPIEPSNLTIPDEASVLPAFEPEPVATIEPPVEIPAKPSTEKVLSVKQEDIIHADIADRIWVNAGPGTGKTYTVIQRIKVLLETRLERPIVILCFSKNAVQVIRERVVEALGNRANALLDDGRLLIRTFDSFATYMLEDELNPAWNYNKRIEEFISMLRRNHGVLDDMISYLIVDEIQDTVGVRARMLLAILDEISCGTLLLGDECQAIFDWTIRDTNDMTFDVLKEQLSKRKFKLYELDENRRQSKNLAAIGRQFREKILTCGEAEQESAVEDLKANIRSRWKSYSLKAVSQLLSGDTNLILTKTNGEAAHISQELYEKAGQISHVMKQSTSHRTLAPWIAKALFGNDGHFLTKEDFMQNARDYELTDTETKWTVLKSLDQHPHAPSLHIPEVLSALVKQECLPEICLNQSNNCAIVSTVHRAKGSEAEHVYWLDGPLLYSEQESEEGTLTDAIRAAYVAVTRAKNDIHLVERTDKVFMRMINESRWIKTGYSKNKTIYCKGIAMKPEDVDVNSFANGSNATDTQMLLRYLDRGMSVTLYPDAASKRFEINFDGQCIGYTSALFTDELFAAFAATNHNKNWPTAIKDVFITAVTTVVSPGCADVASEFSASGCWLGIELGGFPLLEWYSLEM